MSADLDNAKYVSFTSYKKDGTTVSLPVWVVPFEGGYAFTTDPGAFKVKRVRRDARVSLAVCSFKGKVSPDAVTHSGAAVILEGEDGNRVARVLKHFECVHGYTPVSMALTREIPPWTPVLLLPTLVCPRPWLMN
ncbi:MAG: pyridoxamine 5'-phosphate oxidase family protein [Actinobacteria bacterium]|nr:pyridoxamine 5'-phosphate oxidase family protein [Actinomycetota bacterium]